MANNTITKTIKTVLYPTPEQECSLLKTCEMYQKAENLASQMIFDEIQENTIIKELNTHALCYHVIRKAFPKMHSQYANQADRDVKGLYEAQQTTNKKCSKKKRKNSKKDSKYGLSKVVFSGKRPHLTCVKKKTWWMTEDEQFIDISTLDGRIQIPYSRAMLQGIKKDRWELGGAKLFYDRGVWRFHISATKDAPVCETTSEMPTVVGIDRGIRNIIVTYDTAEKTRFWGGKELIERRIKEKETRRHLQEKSTSASRTRLLETGSREQRYVKDLLHRITRELVDSYPAGTVFALENLAGIRGSTEKFRRKDRYVSVSWPFHEFQTLLEYKAKEKGQRVIYVSARGTSQTCPKCQHKSPSNRDRKNHEFKCEKCKYTTNDDRVGAMNVCARGVDKIRDEIRKRQKKSGKKIASKAR